MSRNTRIALSLAIVFSVYREYLGWTWSAPSEPFKKFYIFPFISTNGFSTFTYWVNLVSLITLALWVAWCVFFIRDSK